MARYAEDDLCIAIAEDDKAKKDTISIIEEELHNIDLSQDSLADKLGEIEEPPSVGEMAANMVLRIQEPYKQVMELPQLYKGLINPDIYEGVSAAFLSISNLLPEYCSKMIGQSLSESVMAVKDTINTAWLHDQNTWNVTRETYASLGEINIHKHLKTCEIVEYLSSTDSVVTTQRQLQAKIYEITRQYLSGKGR